MDLSVWPLATASGAVNMAIDEAAMAPARAGALVLRFYAWAPGCFSLGRNQPTGDRVGGRRRNELVPGQDVVRRPTGGRSVYHGPELTYALAVPERFLGGPRAIHRWVHEALTVALRSLGAELDSPSTGTGRERAVLDTAGCFVSPAPGEITAGGRKLVGSAQWRRRGAVLQHGSLLLRNEQGRAGGGAGAIGLDELIDEVPAPVALADAIGRGLADSAGLLLARSAPAPEVLGPAGALVGKYRSSEWTWRR